MRSDRSRLYVRSPRQAREPDSFDISSFRADYSNGFSVGASVQFAGVTVIATFAFTFG